MPARIENPSPNAAQASSAAPILVGIIALYYEKYEAQAVERFRGILRRAHPDFALICVFNRPGYCPADAGNVAGSNRLAEFSAWDEGLARAREIYGNRIAGVVLANDTFCHHRRFNFMHEQAFVNAIRQCVTEREAPACAGDRCVAGQPLMVQDRALTAWLSTYLFTLNARALEGLAWATVPDAPAVDRLFPPGVDADGFFGAGLHESVRKYVAAWLFSDRPGAWYAATPLSPQTRSRLNLKAKCVYLEMLLAHRLEALGTTVFDVNRTFYISAFNKSIKQLSRVKAVLRWALGTSFVKTARR